MNDKSDTHFFRICMINIWFNVNVLAACISHSGSSIYYSENYRKQFQNERKQIVFHRDVKSIICHSGDGSGDHVKCSKSAVLQFDIFSLEVKQRHIAHRAYYFEVILILKCPLSKVLLYCTKTRMFKNVKTLPDILKRSVFNC